MPAEKGIKIPVSAIMRDGQQRRLLDAAAQTATGGTETPNQHWMNRIFSGMSDDSERTLLHRLEETRNLFTESYVVFPSSDESIPQEAVEKANCLGFATAEVPGFSAAPTLIELYKTDEIDGKEFYLLWTHLVPQVPPILRDPGMNLKHPAYYEGEFLKGIVNGNTFVENNGITAYVPTLDKPGVILVENFPDFTYVPYQKGDPFNNPPQSNAGILQALGIPRAGMPRTLLQQTIDAKGEDVIESLGLDPQQWRLHLIRYEDFLRLGNNLNWGSGSFTTFMDGWRKRDDRLAPFAAGKFTSYFGKDLLGYNQGLIHVDNFHEEGEKRLMAEGHPGFMARFAITRKPKDQRDSTEDTL